MGAYNMLYQKILVPNIMLPLGMQGFIPLSLSLLICGALRGSQWCLQLTTKQYPLVFSYAYDIQNQVLGSASQQIQLLDLVGVPNVVHGEVYSTKVHMDLQAVSCLQIVGFLGLQNQQMVETVFPQIRSCLQDITANFGQQETQLEALVNLQHQPFWSILSFNISAGIHCHYFSPKCYMPLLPSTQSVSFSFYCHTGTMVEHKLLIKLSGLFRREHQKPSTQILRNGV